VETLFCGNVTTIVKHTGSVELYQEIIDKNKLDIELYMHALDLYCKSFIQSFNPVCNDPKFRIYYDALVAPGSDYFQTCEQIVTKKLAPYSVIG
jgi:hypothetical protein